MECRRSSGVYFQIEFESSVISYGSKIELAHAINVKLAKKFNWKYRRGKV